MKRAFSFVALAIVVACAPAQSLRSAVTSSNKQICAAMKKKDFKALEKIFKSTMTSDFKYEENGQTQNYDQMMAGMKMGLGQYTKLTEVWTKIVSLKETGSTGSGVMSHMMAGTIVGQDKKVHKMTFSGTSNDSFVKQNGKWKMSKMSWGSEKMTMDGKPFDPTKMGG